MSKTKEKKKRTTGFKLGLAQAIIYLVIALAFFGAIIGFVVAGAIERAEIKSSFMGYLSQGFGKKSEIDWNNDGRYSSYDEADLFLRPQRAEDEHYHGKPYIKVVYPKYEYKYYDFVSENMQDKVWTFKSQETDELVEISFYQVNEYESYLEHAEYDSWAWAYHALASLGAVMAIIAALQFTATFKGGKSYHANNLGITLNTLFFVFGICGLVGAIKDRKLALSTDEKYLARKREKDQRRQEKLARAEREKEKKKLESIEREKVESNGSTFTGGAFANAGINLLTGLVCLLTLGLAYPAMVCWKLRWKCSHTYVSGRQLVFDGEGRQLFGKFLLWSFLSVITLGIYYIVCMKVALAKWQTKHTHFADTVIEEGGENLSKFDGRWYQLLGVNWLCNFVTAITLSFGSYWAHCHKERWFCKHKTIDGLALTFDGKAVQYFGKRFVWTLLTIITFGIYAFWLAVKSEKWTCAHTKIKENA